MDGSPASGLTMQMGDYAYGDLSITGSDLINFDHFYRVGGIRVELNKPCKANATNMSKVTEDEPTTDPPPTEEIVWVEAQLHGKKADGTPVVVYFDPRGSG